MHLDPQKVYTNQCFKSKVSLQPACHRHSARVPSLDDKSINTTTI